MILWFAVTDLVATCCDSPEALCAIDRAVDDVAFVFLPIDEAEIKASRRIVFERDGVHRVG
jgi:hypothetical protein